MSPAHEPVPLYTVVIPVFDESDTILGVVEEIESTLLERPPLEIIVVDDGSGDGTDRKLSAAAAAHPLLRAFRHDRRCGKSAALLTGVRSARAEWVLTMDGDGQNDPRDALGLLAAAPGGGAEPSLIAGVRGRREVGAWRRVSSRVANGVRRAVLRDDCPDAACGLKVFRRDAFLGVPYFDGMHRFLPALFRAHGMEVALVGVTDRPRRGGGSKYDDLSRAVAGIVDVLGVLWVAKRTTLPARTITLTSEAPR